MPRSARSSSTSRLESPYPEIPTDGEHDYFGREPVTHERAAVDGCWPFPVMTHADTLARQQADPSTQQCPTKSPYSFRRSVTSIAAPLPVQHLPPRFWHPQPDHGAETNRDHQPPLQALGRTSIGQLKTSLARTVTRSRSARQGERSRVAHVHTSPCVALGKEAEYTPSSHPPPASDSTLVAPAPRLHRQHHGYLVH
jgi:hypothetical protein